MIATAAPDRRLQAAERTMEWAWRACSQAEQSGNVAEAIKHYDAYLTAYDAWCRLVARRELAPAEERIA